MDKPTVTREVKDVRRNYTRTPNILFESYPDLHPQEKWLFINLVYLCGARGTRHLSIRYIAQRTGISAGALSGSKDPAKNNPGMIRRLHNAGLIHAEVKKKRSQDGSEKEQAQYHITITDIWQLNEVFFIERSKNEHNEEENDESVRNVNTSNDTGVQNMNASVRNMNASGLERSEYERERSDSDTKVRLQNKTTGNSKTTNQEDTYGNVADRELPTPAPDYRPDFSSSQDRPYKSDGNDGHSCNPPQGEINATQPHGDEDRLTPSHPGYRVDDRLDSKRNHYGSEASSAPARDAEDQGHASGSQQPAVAAELSTLQGSSPQASAKLEPKAEQDVLIDRPAVPEMPLQSARWCAETTVLVSEALRGKYYTASQRTNQVSKAKQMFRDFKTITRPQFEEIFTDWVKWWKDHGMGIFTLAGLLARGKDGEVRLQTSLDRLEARSMPTQPKKAGGNAVTVPKDSGMVLWQDAAGVERMMSYAEADENGWNGGFGEYIQHTHYGRTAIV